MPIAVPASKLKQNTGEVLAKAVVDRQDVIIERYGKEYAVILSRDRYQELRDTARQHVMERYRQAQEEVWEATQDIPYEEVEAIVAQALQESRRERTGTNASHS